MRIAVAATLCMLAIILLFPPADITVRGKSIATDRRLIFLDGRDTSAAVDVFDRVAPERRIATGRLVIELLAISAAGAAAALFMTRRESGRGFAITPTASPADQSAVPPTPR